MSPSGTILVLTNDADTTADAVVSALLDRGARVQRWDPGDFPRTSSLIDTYSADVQSSIVTLREGDLDLADVAAVYYRRPSPFAFPDSMNSLELEFARAEADAGLWGLLEALPCRWVNHPRANAAASKPAQLAAARTAGLNPPATLITNDPSAVREFANQHGGRIVYKTLAGGIQHLDGHLAATTQPVDEDTIDDSVSLTAHLFQELLPKKREVRLTIVGETMYAAEIHAHSDAARLDWRTDFNALGYAVGSVPNHVRAGVSDLMARFGLLFAAADFVVTPDGGWRFLELNPNGQWAWIEHETGLPIAAGLASLLLAY